MKPDWKDAPSWANYAAQDGSGDWFWYECEPIVCDECWDITGGLYTKAFSSGAWRDSMEARP